MTILLPAVAAAATDGVLVARRRGQVVHVAIPGADGLTPTGRLRRTTRPLCGRPAPSWPTVPLDGRRLCRPCAAAVCRRCQPDTVTISLDELAVTIDTARTAETVSAARLLMIRTPGATARLSKHVAAAQLRVAGAPALSHADRIAAHRRAPAAAFPRRAAR